MSALTANTALQKRLIWFWDCIDISENIKRAEKTARGQANGLHAWMACVVMVFLCITAGSLAWKFDIESTLIGMQTLRETVLDGLPASALKFTTYFAIALTLAPTLIEMFTSAYAKADIKVVQLVIIAFTGFDLITDIPRAMVFTNQLQANFDQLGILSFIAYWIFFLFWLFFSTLGFELLTVIFGYLAVVFCIKGLAGEEQAGSRSMAGLGKGGNSGGLKSAVVEMDGDKVKVI